MRTAIVLAIAVLVLALLAVGALPAGAHSFYSGTCCSGTDCGPAPLGAVRWTPAGWQVTTPDITDVVPFDDQRIQFTPPGEPQFHICEYPKHKLRCLYIPQPEG